MKSLGLILALLWVAAIPAKAAALNPANVPCWQPRDFSFTAKASPANLFMVAFSATVTAPDGKTFTLPGFFDGNGTARLTPPADWGDAPVLLHLKSK